MKKSDIYAELSQFCIERGWLLESVRVGRLVGSRDLSFKRARLRLVQKKIVELVGELESIEAMGAESDGR